MKEKELANLNRLRIQNYKELVEAKLKRTEMSPRKNGSYQVLTDASVSKKTRGIMAGHT